MGPRDQFGLLSKDDKVKFRDEYLLMTGIPFIRNCKMMVFAH